MHKIIVPTGYMGSGSSAITDIIREIKGYEAHHDSFEYVFLHCPDGVFDLEDKLLIGNNAIRSDEAIHSFRERMNELYYHKFWWPANYKKYLHKDFLLYTEKYINKLVQYRSNNVWYMQQKPNLWMTFQNVIRRLVRMISNGKIILPYASRYAPMQLSFVSAEEFYQVSREYINDIFRLMGLEQENLILDQLLLPHNMWRIDNYFENNMACFVVQRDPRDVFIANKYIWKKNDDDVAYPTEAEEFCKYYRHLRSSEREAEGGQIYRIWFEDLVYDYENSLEKIYKILEVQASEHEKKNMFFTPDKSINNTQLFLCEEYAVEAQIIERQLPEYLYQFPYARKPDYNKTF